MVVIWASLTVSQLALADTVEVSGGGKCEGDITADNLNGKVVCTYSNGDCEASRRHRYEDSLSKERSKDKGLILLPMAENMRGLLVTMRSQDRELELTKTATAIKVNFSNDKLTVREFMLVLIMDVMRDSL